MMNYVWTFRFDNSNRTNDQWRSWVRLKNWNSIARRFNNNHKPLIKLPFLLFSSRLAVKIFVRSIRFSDIGTKKQFYQRHEIYTIHTSKKSIWHAPVWAIPIFRCYGGGVKDSGDAAKHCITMSWWQTEFCICLMKLCMYPSLAALTVKLHIFRRHEITDTFPSSFTVFAVVAPRLLLFTPVFCRCLSSPVVAYRLRSLPPFLGKSICVPPLSEWDVNLRPCFELSYITL